MVMIATGRKEQRAWVLPHHAIEADTFGVKRRSLFEIAHVKMHVSDDRSRGCSAPSLVAGLLQQPCDVQRIRCHHQLPSHSAPALARPVGVDLDAQTVRILEVQRLAHQVIAGSWARADLSQVPDQPAERCAVGQQNGEVIETQGSPPGNWPGSGPRA